MGITEFLAGHITAFISKTGYASVYLLMTGESMVFPIPSEAVMPFAGFLIEEGQFSFPLVILIATLGSITGSMASYWIGAYGGEPFVDKFGKWVLLDREDLEATKRFFNRFGEITILVSRFIPVVRHLISIPAGFGRMNIPRFLVYTIIGAGLWNAFLAWVGYVMKQNWSIVMRYSGAIDKAVLVILFLLFGYFLYKHIGRKKKKRS